MLDEAMPTALDNLWARDRDLQNQTFSAMLSATERHVDWAYGVWDQAVANLTHQDNHHRAIAAQLLCNLAKSDVEIDINAMRYIKSLPSLHANNRDL